MTEMTANQRLNVQLDDLADGAAQAILDRRPHVHAACLEASDDLRHFLDGQFTAVMTLDSLRTLAGRAEDTGRSDAAAVFTATADLIVEAEAEFRSALAGF